MGLIMIGLILCMMSMFVSGVSPPRLHFTCDCSRDPITTGLCCVGRIGARFNRFQRCENMNQKGVKDFVECCASSRLNYRPLGPIFILHVLDDIS
ncbi:unnamed protein product [Adineta steineri]|uniref:Uncharacterized protein n=1 Tax=Adineta steineri TaxID=433720 RepID=A0A814WW20_9BILA|nr:unnamed protein product [Adineta steineri]CAF3849562.1 unnamed protein product [Adineta steineri]